MINSKPHLSGTCKFAPLAICVHTGCLAFPFYTSTKLFLKLLIISILDIYNKIRVFFGPFWRPIFGCVPNAKKYVFFPIWIRKFPIQGRKNNKISPFYDVYVCGWKSGSEQSQWYKGNNQILQTPNGNVPLRQFSRIYSRRCRGVCNKHTWFILLVPYSGVLIWIKRGTFLITKKRKTYCNIFSQCRTIRNITETKKNGVK